MKSEIIETKQPVTFKPFDLKITIESENELMVLWALFNEMRVSNVRMVDEINNHRVWKSLNEKAIEFGLKK